jgi:hypothetical protein
MTLINIGFDTETHLIASGNIIPRFVCSSFAKLDDAWVWSNADFEVLKSIWDMTEGALAGKNCICIQNASFDITVLMRYCQDIIKGEQHIAGDHRQWIEGAHGIYSMLWEILEQNIDRELNNQPLILADTLLRERLYSLSTEGTTDVKASLATLVMKYYGIDLSAEKTDPNAWRLRYSELDGVHANVWPGDAYDYALMDAVYARDIKQHQDTFLQPCGEGSARSESLQIYADVALRLATSHGIEVDTKRAAEVTERMAAEVTFDKLDLLLRSGILRSNNSIDTKKLQAEVQRVCDENGMPVIETKTGISTAAEVIEAVAPFSPILTQYKHRQDYNKMLTAFMPKLKNKVIYANYDVIKETGRTSSYGSDETKKSVIPAYPALNIQQIPRGDERKGIVIRESFIARPGYVLCSTDYSALELCSVGQVTKTLFGSSVHADRVNQGYDMHSFLGSAIASMTESDLVVGHAPGSEESYREFLNAVKRGANETSPQYLEFLMSFKPEGKNWEKKDAVKNRAKHFRTMAKPTGLGYPGMLGPRTFMTFAKTTYGVEVTFEEATELRNMWRAIYPEAMEMKDWVEGQKFGKKYIADLGKQVDTYAYETPGFGRFRAHATYNAAANGMFMQSLSADGAKLAGCWIARAMYGGLPANHPWRILEGCRILAFIHDEYITELPDDEWVTERALLIAHIQCLAMKQVMPDITFSINAGDFPDADAKPSVEPALMYAWTKAADPVWERSEDEAARVTRYHCAEDQMRIVYPEINRATEAGARMLVPWEKRARK